LKKPLQTFFLTPGSSLDISFSDDYYPVILLTASAVVPGGYQRYPGFTYVQGAADDEESWSHGLRSSQFWEHAETLLYSSTEDELIGAIKRIIDNEGPKEMLQDISAIASTGVSIGIGSMAMKHATIICGAKDQSTKELLYLSIPSKIKPVVALTQTIFPAVITFAVDNNILSYSPLSILAVDTSKDVTDLAVGVSLVLLSLFFDDQGSLISSQLM